MLYSYEILVQFFADDGTYFQSAYEQEKNTEQDREAFQNDRSHRFEKNSRCVFTWFYCNETIMIVGYYANTLQDGHRGVDSNSFYGGK